MKRKRQPVPVERMLNVRISTDLLDSFREKAKANERTVSQEVRLLMTQHVEREAA